MNIITVNVGQGALSIIRHNREAIIVDCRIPPSSDDTVAFVKQMFATALKDHGVRGLVLTGFDDDHTDVVGIALVLQKYRPDWVMYPQYYKNTQEAKSVFHLIDEQENERRGSTHPLRRISVRLDRGSNRRVPGLADNFDFELFSPHPEDMNSSNNCSIVLKVLGRGSSGFSYLITGDTEVERWQSIDRLFGGALKSHVLAAAHHGSINGVHPGALLHIDPHTVLISAGVDSQYGHPDPAAVKTYKRVAKYVYATNMQGGVSLLTKPGTAELTTTLIGD
jgi:beta-lactamase superfamily II metal-dependent hydrolase